MSGASHVMATLSPSAEIVGRVTELTAVEAFLVDATARALVLEGEAGIGKTTLWRAGVEAARDRGYTLLAAQPAAVEAELALAGLRDLLRDVPPDVQARLPRVQQSALAAALGRDVADAPDVDGGLLGVATAGLLSVLAQEQPVLLAIDDLQWLDDASGAVAVYALRRLGDANVRLFASCRSGPDAPLPFALQQALPGPALARVRLGPLSEGAIRRLLRLREGISLTRLESHAVYVASQGNPFFALELGRAGISTDASGAILLPQGLQGLVDARLGELPARTRDALLFVAALSSPTLGVLGKLGVEEDLETALAAGVLELYGARVRFPHPLVSSAAWAAADEHRRREVHRLLADAVEDDEERVRHLAAAAEPPDRRVSELLASAAAAARRKGAPSAAADLLSRARELVPSTSRDRWAELSAQAAEAHAQAGHWDSVLELVEEAQERLPAGAARAAILVAAGEMRPGQEELLTRAVAEAGETAVGVHARIALSEQQGFGGRWRDGVQVTGEAVRLARQLGDPGLLAVALTWFGGHKLLDSQLDGRRDIDEAAAIARDLRSLPTTVFQTPQTWQGVSLLFGDDPHGALAFFEGRLAAARERGDDLSAFQSMQLIVLAHARAGELGCATLVGRQALELVDVLGYEYGRPVLLGALATVAAYEGDLEHARLLAAEAVAGLSAFGDRLWSTFALGALALTELCAGDARAACAHAREIGDRFPGQECWWSFHQGDELEALVLAGEHEQALARAEALRAAGAELALPRFLVWANRGEGLVRAAEGDLAAAEAVLGTAIAGHEQFGLPLERGRTLLAYGHVLRREKRRREARSVLEGALAELERIGSRHFARAAQEELQHVGGRAPAGEHELTGAEERVARLVAQGHSNREVAAQLFVEVSTVEATLTHIYRKLGLSSRSQLAHMFR